MIFHKKVIYLRLLWQDVWNMIYAEDKAEFIYHFKQGVMSLTALFFGSHVALRVGFKLYLSKSRYWKDKKK